MTSLNETLQESRDGWKRGYEAKEAALAKAEDERDRYLKALEAGLACADRGCHWGCGEAIREALNGDTE